MSVENLGRLLDLQPNGYVRESTQYVKASGLKMDQAKAIMAECAAAQWAATAHDETNQEWPADALTEDYEPFRIDITKPPSEVDRVILTRVGFESYLKNDCREGHCCRVVGLSSAFASQAASFVPWNSNEQPKFTPARATKNPIELVREYGANRVPKDVRHWLLDPASDRFLADPMFLIWARLSSQALLLCLPDEIEPGTGNLRFKGPPRLSAPAWSHDEDLLQGLGQNGFANLQMAVGWVFEDIREAETRHNLLANEIARSGEVSGSTAAWIGQNVEAALQSAKLAHQMHLSNLTAEMIKALQELRKAVAEETAKTTEATRALIAAIASALAVEIGLVASKVATPEVIKGIMGAAVAYVLAVAASGAWFIWLQRKARESWKE